MSAEYICADCRRSTRGWSGDWRCGCGGELLRVVDLLPYSDELREVDDEPLDEEPDDAEAR